MQNPGRFNVRTPHQHTGICSARASSNAAADSASRRTTSGSRRAASSAAGSIPRTSSTDGTTRPIPTLKQIGVTRKEDGYACESSAIAALTSRSTAAAAYRSARAREISSRCQSDAAVTSQIAKPWATDAR